MMSSFPDFQWCHHSQTFEVTVFRFGALLYCLHFTQISAQRMGPMLSIVLTLIARGWGRHKSIFSCSLSSPGLSMLLQDHPHLAGCLCQGFGDKTWAPEAPTSETQPPALVCQLHNKRKKQRKIRFNVVTLERTDRGGAMVPNPLEGTNMNFSYKHRKH